MEWCNLNRERDEMWTGVEMRSGRCAWERVMHSQRNHNTHRYDRSGKMVFVMLNLSIACAFGIVMLLLANTK